MIKIITAIQIFLSCGTAKFICRSMVVSLWRYSDYYGASFVKYLLAQASNSSSRSYLAC